MKRVIKSASIADEQASKEADLICKKAEELLSILDAASEYTLDKYELHLLHDRLNEDASALSFDLRSKSNMKAPKYEDMW